jgi:hypothetical protein
MYPGDHTRVDPVAVVSRARRCGNEIPLLHSYSNADSQRVVVELIRRFSCASETSLFAASSVVNAEAAPVL